MIKSLKNQQFFNYCLSSLLIALIAVLCLKMNSNLPVRGYLWNKTIARQFNVSISNRHPRVAPVAFALRSTPYSYYFVLEQVIDGQVYTPNKMKEKASNIKKNLSLAKLRL